MTTIFGYSTTKTSGRPKKTLTYGKTARSDDNDHHSSKPPLQRPSLNTKVNSHNTNGAPRLKSPRGAVPPTRYTARDEFDVPDSDDEQRPTLPSTVSRQDRRANEFDVPLSDEDESPTTPSRQSAKPLVSHIQSHRAMAKSQVDMRHEKDAFTARVSYMSTKKRKREDRPTAAPATSGVSLRQPDTVSETSAASGGTVAISRRPMRLQQPSPARKTPLKGLSAPARLVEMVDADSPGTARDYASPVKNEAAEGKIIAIRDRATPRKRAPAGRSSSLTPQQRKLWDQLIPSDPTAPPEVPSTSKDTLSGRQSVSREAKTHLERSLGSNVKPRLVDRLKGSDATELSDNVTDDDDVKTASVTSELSSSMQDSSSEGSIASPQPAGEAKPPTTTATGSKATYAQTRTYLQEDNFEDSLMMLDLPVETNSQHKVSQSAFDMDDSDDEPSQGMRSIHDLRAAGTKKRFRDDMDVLLQDIRDHTKAGWSRRRSALIELTTQLTDKTFAAQFQEGGFYNIFQQEADAVLNQVSTDGVGNTILIAACLQLLAQDVSRHALTELQKSSLVQWLLSQLNIDASVTQLASDRRANMSKLSQKSILDFAHSMLKSSLWGGDGPDQCAPSILAFKAIELLILKLRESGNRSLLIRDESTLSLLMQFLALSDSQNLSATDRRLKHEMAISILESESVSFAASSPTANKSWMSSQLPHLASSLPVLLSPEASRPHSTILLLRLCLNLTNNKPRACAAFGKDATVHSILTVISSNFLILTPSASVVDPSINEVADLDLLLLALGLAINLAEYAPTVRQKAQRDLPSLVKIFIQGRRAASQAESLEQSRTNVAYGYLAVLLGNVCQDPECRKIVHGLLPGRSFNVLIDSIEEFIGFNQRADELEGNAKGKDVWEGFTRRLRSVLDKIRD